MKHKRKWGFYEILHEDADCKIKRLTLNGGASISLQTHKHRNELWTLIEGSALARTNMELRVLNEPGAHVYIQRGHPHQLTNLGMRELVIIEVQTGTYFGEDDIERYRDIDGWRNQASHVL